MAGKTKKVGESRSGIAPWAVPWAEEGLGGLGGEAGYFSPMRRRAMRTLGEVAGGRWLRPETNPYLASLRQAMAEQQAKDISNLKAQYTRFGHFLSTPRLQALSQLKAQQAAQTGGLFANLYEREMGRRQAALAQIMGYNPYATMAQAAMGARFSTTPQYAYKKGLLDYAAPIAASFAGGYGLGLGGK